MKIVIKIFFLSIFAIISACGYKPIFHTKNIGNINKIKSIKYLGNNNYIFYFKNFSNFKENKNLKEGYSLTIDIKESSSAKTINASGIVTEEEVSILIKINLRDEKQKVLLDQQFAGSRTIELSNDTSSDQTLKKIELQNIVEELSRKIFFTINVEISQN